MAIWTHLNSSYNTEKSVPEFFQTLPSGQQNYFYVAPPSSMGPQAQALKKAQGFVSFTFDNIVLNFGDLITIDNNFLRKKLNLTLASGVSFLRISQNLSSIFSNNVGFPATPISYAVAADPEYSFLSRYKSKFVGAGPDIDIKFDYDLHPKLNLYSDLLFTLAMGQVSMSNSFVGNSLPNQALGISTNRQYLTNPDQIHLVPGFDSKVGFNYQSKYKDNAFNLTFGYRFALYVNALWYLQPSSLVEPGTNTFGPEVATGSMNINAVKDNQFNFSFNGPFVSLSIKS